MGRQIVLSRYSGPFPEAQAGRSIRDPDGTLVFFLACGVYGLPKWGRRSPPSKIRLSVPSVRPHFEFKVGALRFYSLDRLKINKSSCVLFG
jgi:hypothetical protein